jgi:AraC-like DNA-binding protein
VLSTADLQRRFLHADSGLSTVLEQRVREVIARLPPLETVSGRARAILAEEFDGGRPTAATIGRRLGLSVRTLHRHLRAEGTSLRAVTLELRRELSQRYLREGATIGEVAFLLGYSEASAFHRSFRRWTGRTPSAYRRDRTSGAP